MADAVDVTPGPGLPRGFEVVLCAVGLTVLGPLLVAIALAIKVTSPGPVLFRQRRIGRGGEPFTLHKFRSMRIDTPGSRVTAAGDRRITPVGRVLRRTKLDELPELFDVLRGDMALVGPRPEVPAYYDPTSPLWRPVVAVRPGLTDPVTLRLRNEEALLASVAGPEDAGAREAFYRDVLLPYKLRGQAEYAARRTRWSDLRLLVLTLWRVLVPSSAPPPSIEEVRASVEG